MTWKCLHCGKSIEGAWNHKNGRFEPVSLYWNEVDLYDLQDIVEAFCSPRCATDDYEQTGKGEK